MRSFDWSAVAGAWPALLGGLGFSIRITLVGFLGGLLFGALIAIARIWGAKPLAAAAATYVTLVRSIPLIMVIFWFFFLVPWGLGWLTGSNRPVPVGSELTAYLTFTLFEAAYYAEIVRAGIQSVSSGQYAACRALALTRVQALRLVVLPQAFRNVLPIMLTQTIILFQDTSLVYVMSATDLFGAASKIAQRDGRLVEMYASAGFIYFVICFCASQGVRRLQRRFAHAR